MAGGFESNCRLEYPKLLNLLKEPENLLFAYWEYHGTDFAADMAKMKLVPQMQEWWKITDPMQAPFDTRKPGEWWAGMELVFHTD